MIVNQCLWKRLPSQLHILQWGSSGSRRIGDQTFSEVIKRNTHTRKQKDLCLMLLYLDHFYESLSSFKHRELFWRPRTDAFVTCFDYSWTSYNSISQQLEMKVSKSTFGGWQIPVTSTGQMVSESAWLWILTVMLFYYLLWRIASMEVDGKISRLLSLPVQLSNQHYSSLAFVRCSFQWQARWKIFKVFGS